MVQTNFGWEGVGWGEALSVTNIFVFFCFILCLESFDGFLSRFIKSKLLSENYEFFLTNRIALTFQ